MALTDIFLIGCMTGFVIGGVIGQIIGVNWGRYQGRRDADAARTQK